MDMAEFQQVYEQLRGILKPFEPSLRVEREGEQVRKSYVSFYLMPVYLYPELLDGMSPQLKARMQGKSCFNFKKVEPALLEELGRLAKRGFERYKQEGLL